MIARTMLYLDAEQLEALKARVRAERVSVTELMRRLVRQHLGRPAALTFWEALRDLRVPILTCDPADLEAAWRIAQAFPDQDLSLTDCTSFALMERLGIDEAFAFDGRFRVYRNGANRRRAFRRHPE